MAKVFQVGFVRAEPEGIGFARDIEEALSVSWEPGATVTRYTRTWLLTRPLSRGRLWSGRIGFTRREHPTSVHWDPQRQDFRSSKARGLVIVPFAIDTATGAVAFQLLAGVVQPVTFAGAFQDLLNRTAVYRWRVMPLVLHRRFDEWSRSVSRVTQARFRLEQPNPGWEDKKEVENILEGLDAEIANLEVRASQGDSLNIQGPLFQQALDHVLQDYGHAALRGVDVRGRETDWNSADGGTVPLKGEVVAPGEPDEVPVDLLAEELDRQVALLQPAAALGGDEERDDN